MCWPVWWHSKNNCIHQLHFLILFPIHPFHLSCQKWFHLVKLLTHLMLWLFLEATLLVSETVQQTSNKSSTLPDRYKTESLTRKSMKGKGRVSDYKIPRLWRTAFLRSAWNLSSSSSSACSSLSDFAPVSTKHGSPNGKHKSIRFFIKKRRRWCWRHKRDEDL